MLFDQGIGDLFVIRVAGNVADVDEIGTLEYGVEHLHTPLVVVMGHSKCGAVTAVVQHAHVSKNIERLVDNIVPAVESVKVSLPGAKGDTLVNAAIDANVLQSIADLLVRSPDARELVAAGKAKVVGAVYDIHTGSVRWLGEHPHQSQLLQATPGIAESPAHAPATHAPTAHEPANPHAAHGKEAAHPADHSDKHTTSTHGGAEPQAAAEHRPLAPHQSGTLKGMLLPAAFLGGAGLVSGAIFKFCLPRPAPAAAVEDAAAPQEHA
jgi:carbonic anhydrase